MTTLSALGEAAMHYASRGWPVFPLIPGDKIPMKGTHGFKDATLDGAKIATWWRKEPQSNIGIATGERANLFVVDLDPDKGSDTSLSQMEEQFEVLPPTYTVGTGSGGLHLYFRYPEVPKGFRLSIDAAVYPGVDYRGELGYVVAPPSIHPTGALYECLSSTSPVDLPTSFLFLFLVLQQDCRQHEILAASASAITGYSEGFVPPEEYFLEEALRYSEPGRRDTKAFRLANMLYRYAVPEQEAASILAEYARRCPAGSHPYTRSQALRCVERVYGGLAV